MLSLVRKDRFPKCDGMVPTRPMPVRFKTATLRFLDPQVTPIQLQTDVLVDQLVAKKRFGSEVT